MVKEEWKMKIGLSLDSFILTLLQKVKPLELLYVIDIVYCLKLQDSLHISVDSGPT